MKKFNYLLLGLAGLAFASCSQDDLVGPATGDGNVNITVKLPADMATRALGDGLTADNLHIAVYDYNATTKTNTFVFETEATFGGAIQTTVSLNLPQNKTYNIAFFAVSEAGEDVYQFNANAAEPNITVQYANYESADNLADAYDCFYKLEAVDTSDGAINKTVTLVRPVAQLNWGTNDLSQAVVDEAAFGANGQNLVSTLVIEKAYTQFGLLTSDVIGTLSEVTISGLASPASNVTSAQWTYPVDPANYKYIAMQYVLAPYNAGNGGLYNVSLDAYNTPNQADATVDNEEVVVSNCPVQANYRTNIYGSLLTNPNEFTVIKNADWGTPDYDPSFELALQRGGTFTLQNDVTLDKSYNISKNLTINLNGHNITYEPDETLETEEAEGMFYVTNGGNLKITGQGNITSEDVYTLVFVDGGEATIEGGSFEGPVGMGNLVYVFNGTAYIKGGSYKLIGQELNAENQYPINCNDAAYKNGTAKIIVTGGTFYNFDPSDNIAEGKNSHTNFLADGYEAVSTGTEGDMWYTVVPENATVASTSEALASAISEATSGDIITVLPGSYTFPAITDFKEKGIVIDCIDGVVFTGTTNFMPESGKQYGIRGATIKNATFSNPGGVPIKGYLYANFVNCNFNGANIRDFYLSGPSSFTNCKFNATATYAFHIDSTVLDKTEEQTVNPEVEFTGCEFNGFIAVSKIQALNFNDCTFASNGNYGGGNFYVPSYFTSCQFELQDPFTSTEYIYLISPNTDYVFNDCYNNGELITTSWGTFRFYTTGITVTCNGQSYTYN